MWGFRTTKLKLYLTIIVAEWLNICMSVTEQWAVLPDGSFRQTDEHCMYKRWNDLLRVIGWNCSPLEARRSHRISRCTMSQCRGYVDSKLWRWTNASHCLQVHRKKLYGETAGWAINVALCSCLYFCQLSTDFPNSFITLSADNLQ